jgi:formamidopyrimidine-DNA glycosylase
MIYLDNGACLAFHDMRRFGRALVLPKADENEYWRRLGPEPMERSFTPGKLGEITGRRRKPIKPLLMDQSLLAGIGNIYADEALFGAGIHPLRSSASLDSSEISKLHASIRDTLRTAIRLQGSSIDTYVNARGERGRYQDQFKVHRRQGERCPACGALIEKMKVGGRGTYICPRCQQL